MRTLPCHSGGLDAKGSSKKDEGSAEGEKKSNRLKRESNLKATLLIYRLVYVPDFTYAHEFCVESKSTRLELFYCCGWMVHVDPAGH